MSKLLQKIKRMEQRYESQMILLGLVSNMFSFKTYEGVIESTKNEQKEKKNTKCKRNNNEVKHSRWGCLCFSWIPDIC